MLSDVMEDYIKAIYNLQESGDGNVSTSELADYLGVKPPTVTSMVDKLEEKGFVEREKYKGVELTDDGMTVALEVVRHHRLLESFLVEHLDYDWSEVHDEAEVLEHHISEEFEERVAQRLGDPSRDPHGDPIPDSDLEPPDSDRGSTLDEHKEGDEVVVTRVSDRSDDDLRYLSEAGITPETRLEIVEVAPFGMVTVRHSEGEQSLSEEVASSVHVRAVASDEGHR
ncbi:MAG: metal-dependent transcriptional regulator, partial [Halobacteria archaeon]|nr:metal-dependent transcriptional regulator [Halobacteria archaeon]